MKRLNSDEVAELERVLRKAGLANLVDAAQPTWDPRGAVRIDIGSLLGKSVVADAFFAYVCHQAVPVSFVDRDVDRRLEVALREAGLSDHDGASDRSDAR